MEIILLERVENLGAIGDVVKVKNGFARNYLFPQHKALLATDANKARFERERVAIEARNEKAKRRGSKLKANRSTARRTC
jgi:large subunit ribosomal protein L9